MSSKPPDFRPYRPPRLPPEEMVSRARAFYALMQARRSVRDFSPEPVAKELIDLAIRTAASAPSGAHRQPWTFVAVSDPRRKRQIRLAAEEQERQSHEGGRMPPEWLEAIAPFGVDWRKEFLDTAPWIVVVFEQAFAYDADGQRRKNYYVKESVGIACGLFVTALHQMGLATLTHTPSPMRFLADILDRPDNERPFMLFPVGYPADDAMVPDIRRKPPEEISVFDPGA